MVYAKGGLYERRIEFGSVFENPEEVLPSVRWGTEAREGQHQCYPS